MFEVSESTLKPVDMTPTELEGQEWPAVVRDTLAGAVATGLIFSSDEVVSFYHRRLEYGYPTPSLERDAAVSKALPWLRERSIWSRGRFGSWKYEVGNQDHSLMLGVEAADNILFGTPELTLRHPNIVNAKRNEELRYKRTDTKDMDNVVSIAANFVAQFRCRSCLSFSCVAFDNWILSASSNDSEKKLSQFPVSRMSSSITHAKSYQGYESKKSIAGKSVWNFKSHASALSS
jgi:hypothetical protein